ncbi:MAG TPA: hypothetical protein VNC61_13410 [Acidimicrobiales bacterium]|nr:hypothetical protein [Acidimicrobiales bacterium]
MGAKHVVGAVLLGAVMSVATPVAAFAGSGGTEHFTLVFDSQTGPGSIFASGAFTAGGTDYQGHTTDDAVFAAGGFKIHHGHVKGTFRFDQKIYTGHQGGSGTYTINGGFGVYAKIKASGTAHIRGTIETARNANGTCNFHEITAYSLIVHAGGPVSF